MAAHRIGRREGPRESALNAVSSADNVLNGRTIGAASAAIAAECAAVRALIQQMKGGNNTVMMRKAAADAAWQLNGKFAA